MLYRLAHLCGPPTLNLKSFYRWKEGRGFNGLEETAIRSPWYWYMCRSERISSSSSSIVEMNVKAVYCLVKLFDLCSKILVTSAGRIPPPHTMPRHRNLISPTHDLFREQRLNVDVCSLKSFVNEIQAVFAVYVLFFCRWVIWLNSNNNSWRQIIREVILRCLSYRGLDRTNS